MIKVDEKQSGRSAFRDPDWKMKRQRYFSWPRSPNRTLIKFVVKRANNTNYIKYLWIRCDCLDKVTAEVLRDHLIINGIDQSYTRWIWHGESIRGDRPIISNDRRCDKREEIDFNEDDQLEDMIHDVVKNFTDRPQLFESLKNDPENIYMMIVLHSLNCLQCWYCTIWK